MGLEFADAASSTTADPSATLGEHHVRTSIVLPVYNERENLHPLVGELVDVVESNAMACFRPVEITVVDDGSTDGTNAVIRELAAEFDSVRGVFLSRNFGQSAALSAGIDESVGEYIVTLDGDGQNDPADVPRLLSRLTDGYDCVSGWRKDRRDPFTKTIPSAVQTSLATLTGPDIHDFGCTLKAYRADAIEEIQLRGEGHRYIPAKLYDRGFSITEVPVNHRPRTAGSSKYGAGRLLRGFVDLGFEIFWNRYSVRPLHLLGGLGVSLLAVGGLLGSHAVVSKYAFGAALTPHLPRLVLTIALILFGFQLVMFGVLAEMLSRLLYQDECPYRIERVDNGETPEQRPNGRPAEETATGERTTAKTAERDSETPRTIDFSE
ncbi:glycosyltransferase family 2 protein [Halomontanus rarus]|uniref:glycosyltransferase family 2 protein n=1 Tax=Halomontanus rarus TaxID=3034020 RepID=UPI0023E8E468|nr:glycosyltransferase family 2 protein [Halovivax sp. TS33]